MGLKAAVFCHKGLGDGINTLVLSNNLHLNGFQVDTYHPALGSMQNWCPHLPICSYPSIEALSTILHKYDLYFLVWDDDNQFVLRLIEEGKRRFPEKIKVIYLYPSRHIIREPYYSDCLVDPSLSVAENMRRICERILRLPKSTQSSGLIPPEGSHFQKYPKRVAIHPTSTRPSKNWPKAQYVKLALHLQKEGFDPVFIPGNENLKEWSDVLELGLGLAAFDTFDGLACYLYESGYLIGNDSGLAHLASALKIPTLTFFRRRALAKLWAPSFTKGIALTPSSWIPNIRGLRWRDRYWKLLITLGMARRGFEALRKSSKFSSLYS